MMKRLLLIVLLGLIGFYVAWPAVSAWQIHSAVEARDPEQLSSKIDFPAVRDSMRPAVEAKISQRLEELKSSGGSTAAILGGLVQGGLLTQITEVVLRGIVTPQNMIRLAHQPGTLPEKIDGIIREQFGELRALQQPGSGGDSNDAPTSGVASILNKIEKITGGVVKTLEREGQPVTTIEKSAESSKSVDSGSGSGIGAGKPPPIGLGNIKSFSFAGPLAFDVGFARDANSPTADLMARMEFKEFDWKLSRVVPNF